MYQCKLFLYILSRLYVGVSVYINLAQIRARALGRECMTLHVQASPRIRPTQQRWWQNVADGRVARRIGRALQFHFICTYV
jgi:hypothetical protein